MVMCVEKKLGLVQLREVVNPSEEELCPRLICSGVLAM